MTDKEPRADLDQPVFITHCVNHGWQAGDGTPREGLVRCATCGMALPQFSFVHARHLAASEGKEPVTRTLPADYESFWEQRYNEQHRTLHSCEDALGEARERAERAEAAARDFVILAQRIVANAPAKSAEPWEWIGLTMDALSGALARHPSFSSEEGTEG